MEILIENEVEKFITTLEKQTIAKILHSIDLLEYFDYKLGLPHSKKIKTDLFELRIRGQQEIRIFYTFQKNKIILFYGFIKKSQKIPQKEITQAVKKLQNLT